jgi:hypothetical protein
MKADLPWASTLRQCATERDRQVPLQGGQILRHELLLQRYGRGRHDHGASARTREHDGRQQVAQSLSRAGAGLDRSDTPGWWPQAFFRVAKAAQGLRQLGHHHELPPAARVVRHGLAQRAQAGLHLGFFCIGEHADSFSRHAASSRASTRREAKTLHARRPKPHAPRGCLRTAETATPDPPSKAVRAFYCAPI